MFTWTRLKFFTSQFKPFTLALGVTFLLLTAYQVQQNNQHVQAQLTNACMTVKSNLPMNHTGHPCNVAYMPNQSWWSWASSDSKSVHMHFLDLVELMHHSFY